MPNLPRYKDTARRLDTLAQQAIDVLLEGADGDPLRAIGLWHVLSARDFVKTASKEKPRHASRRMAGERV